MYLSKLKQGKAETNVHYNTKIHIYHQLKQRLKSTKNPSKLKMKYVCNSKVKWGMEYPLWTCNNHRMLDLMDYRDVHVEYTVPSIGRFDIAVTGQTPDDLIGVVEVCHTSPMTPDKIARLNKDQIPWVEIKAEHFFYTDLIYKNEVIVPKWNPDIALPAIDSIFHQYHWTCSHCEKPGKIELLRVLSIVDIYKDTLVKGDRHITRKVQR
eukprot:TRINITY_DN3667_c0_g1_i1.p1 TRINITY_DN3667_c0_g1~~TRINITY_DN3667_c0_g1_i1.p1  ORF type:complete len:209 (+),score=34.94 TRINITY_DN3667_c0_g1_i1:43-669(+)